MEQVTNFLMAFIGLFGIIWPERLMEFHRRGWSLLMSEQTARDAARTVFMPPRYIFPRVLGFFFTAFGTWSFVANLFPALL